MKCPKCNSENVNVSVNTYTVSQRRSFLWNLLWIICTGGLWLIWMLVRKKKEKVKTKKVAVCSNCGYSWEIK